MSCPNANAPIDINNQNVAGKCDLKCAYNFKYPNSSCVATNRGDYISVSYDTFSTAPVTYNTVDYNVKEVRIYNPSIHSFNGIKTAGEIVIIHISNKGTKPLLVCVPLTQNNSSTSGSYILDLIVNSISLNAPSDGESTTITMDNFTLDSFVPNIPFYSYTAIQPYQPCVGDVDLIVYGSKLAACYISDDTLSKLKSVNTENTYTIKTGPLLFFNSKGPNQSNGNDDIYIDCQPVNKSAQQETVTVSSTSSSSTSMSIDWSAIFNSPVFQVILGSLLFVFIIIFFRMLLTLMSGGQIDLPDFTKASKTNTNTNTKTNTNS
jgi:carbonic anhydrase